MAVEKYGKKYVGREHGAGGRAGAKGFPVSYALAESLEGIARAWRGSRNRSASSRRTARSSTSARRWRSRSWRRRSSGSRRTAPNEFYEGETAKRFAAEMAKHGGIITEADLKNYKAIERTPLTGKYTDYTDHHRAAVELRRHRAARDARHPRRHRLREGRRRLRVAPFITWPRRCAAPTPIATSTSAIRRS